MDAIERFDLETLAWNAEVAIMEGRTVGASRWPEFRRCDVAPYCDAVGKVYGVGILNGHQSHRYRVIAVVDGVSYARSASCF